MAGVLLAPQERGQARIAAQRVDIPVPPMMEVIAAVVHVPPIMVKIGSGVHLAPHERQQERLAVQSLDISKKRIAKFWNDPVRPNKEDIAKVRQLVTKMNEFVEGEHAFEKFWSDPVRPNKEDIAKVRQLVTKMIEFVEGGHAFV